MAIFTMTGSPAVAAGRRVMCDDLNCLVDRILSAAREVAEARQRRAQNALANKDAASASNEERQRPPADDPRSGGSPQGHWIWRTLDEL